MAMLNNNNNGTRHLQQQQLTAAAPMSTSTSSAGVRNLTSSGTSGTSGGEHMVSTVASLATLFAATLSFVGSDVKNAENLLNAEAAKPGFLSTLLRLLHSPEVDVLAKQAAAIFFKNFVKRRWDSAPEMGGLSKEDRESVKAAILELSMTSPKPIQVQLVETISRIATTDFPLEWETLLSELMEQHFASGDIHRKRASMQIVRSIVSRYRTVLRSNSVLHDLKFFVLPAVCDPMLQTFTGVVTGLVSQSFTDKSEMVAWSQILLDLLHCFVCLHAVDIPEFFEERIQIFFNGFMALLRVWDVPSLESPDDITPGILDDLKTEILMALDIYAERYSEQFMPFNMECVRCVLEVLNRMSQGLHHDNVVCAGLKVLATVASVHWDGDGDPFALRLEGESSVDVLKQLCNGVIIPNIQLRDTDRELMTDNPQEYIRRDIEGADIGTRRDAAMSLVRALQKFHEKQITDLLSAYVGELLQRLKSAEASSSSEAQAELLADASIYLVTALSIKSQTRARGVLEVSAHVDILNFFNDHLLKELVAHSPLESRPIVKSSTLKFVAVFRNQLPAERQVEIFPLLVKHISSAHPIVHTYAASCIDRLLTTRLDPVNPNSPLKLPKAAVQRDLLTALETLLQTVEQRRGVPENEYLMRCIMRIGSFLSADGANLSVPTLQRLLAVVQRTAENPCNAPFNHFVFEAVAVFIRGGALAGYHKDIENLVLTAVVPILQLESHDFVPYCFQVVGLLLDTASVASPHYEEIIDFLLAEQRWTISTANVPGIIRLLAAFFRKSAVFSDVLRQRMKSLLERFQYCVCHKRLLTQAFQLLNDIFEFVPFELYKEYYQTVVMILLSRLQAQRTETMKQEFTVSILLSVCRTEALVFPPSVNTIQAGLYKDVMTGIILKTAVTLAVPAEKKLSILGLARLLTAPETLADGALLAAVLDAMLTLIKGTPESVSRTATKKMKDDAAAASEIIIMLPIEPEEEQGSFNSLQCTQIATNSDRTAHIGDLRGTVKFILCRNEVSSACWSIPSYKELCDLLQ